ncbi:hypothetical protein Y032_0621g747 [Ancylostoma ceylanicum]|nr:hypothetical protein Y032_0621g747 [Ancylostoma ceylanicum]
MRGAERFQGSPPASKGGETLRDARIHLRKIFYEDWSTRHEILNEKNAWPSRGRKRVRLSCGCDATDPYSSSYSRTRVVFEGDSPLATANLDIKNKSFRVVRATFRENSIIALKKVELATLMKFNRCPESLTFTFQGKILPGHEGSMRELDFSKNRISHIESGTFSGFKSLNKLYLSFNRLNQLKK